MAAQVLSGPDDAVAIVELSDPGDPVRVSAPVPVSAPGTETAVETGLPAASDRMSRVDVTYGDLRARVASLAARLRHRGVGRGDVVGVLMGQSADCVVAHAAAWWLGAISVPLFRLFKRDGLKIRIETAGLGLVLTDSEGAAQLGDLAEPFPIRGETSGSSRDPATPPMADTGPEDPALLAFTSGTTGAPKGALHPHRLLTGHFPGVSLAHEGFGQPGDCAWTPADWAWLGGLLNIALPGLALGVPVIAVRKGKFAPDDVARIVRDGGARNLFLPPTALRMLKAADARVPGLRTVASGGEALGAEMLDWGRGAFGLTINEFYGQTECNLFVTGCAAEFEPVPGTIGRATPGHEVAVLDSGGRPLGPGEEGEIAVRRGSASMMLEYWNRPDATMEKYRGEWMLTGDRGCLDGPDGDRFRFLGRDDDVITSSGYRIGPAEVEDCLLTHPAVATAGVVGKPDALRTEIVKAYVVLKPGAKTSGPELGEWVRDRLSAHAYPREVAFEEELPMTVTGKVVRKELKARAAAESRSGANGGRADGGRGEQ